MPGLLSLSSWNLSSVTLASTKSKSQRNKLRRRRRPPPLRDMSGVVNGVGHGHGHGNAEVVPPMPTPMTATNTARSASPTLHEKHVSSEPRERDTDKDDAQAQVITSLRAQITDLITQVSQLNSKLVKSYDRVSDLEDELHVASANGRTASLKISNLEIERAQHLSALNTGLYVEKEHVTAELTRLMERATSEAAARGQAESARANIEKELDDLSASLFAQANTMVAEARLERAMSERKVVEAEMALKSAEEAVGVMQLQMQALRDEKDRTDDEISRLRILMAKGKFVEHPPMVTATSVKLLCVHALYQEFMQFIVHLRTIRHSTLVPPHISTLLPLPFLARIQNEDSDPTVRLDLAPSLNWLSRRSVLSAIHSGQLTIEPMSVATLMSESTFGLPSLTVLSGSQPSISCALCGAHIYPPKSDAAPLPPPSHPLSSLSLGRHASSTTWSSSIFKNPLSNVAPSPPPTPPRETSTPATPTHSSIGLTTVYVFRIAQTQTSHPPSSYPQSLNSPTQRFTSYPICTSGWCLARLRTTCSLWAFIRAGVIDRLWEEEPVPHRPAAPPSISSASSYSLASSFNTNFNNNASTPTLASTGTATPQKEAAPPLPPRRRSKMSSSVNALWGMASGALRSATPSSTNSNSSQPASPAGNGTPKEKEMIETPMPTKRTVPPPPLEPLKVDVRPPLPRRNLDRRVSSTPDDKPKEEVEENRTGLSEESNAEPSSESSSPKEDAAKSVTSDKTLRAPSREISFGSPMLQPQHITVSTSQGSSALSGAGEEFTTPVEEISSLQMTEIPPRPSTPHSPRSPRSPRSPQSSARNSVSPPPRSPSAHQAQRISSPPPLSSAPHSPRVIPLPDSRPSTPASPHRTTSHIRRESGTVPIVPLNIDPEKANSRPPSRAGAASPSPRPVVAAAAAPPLPRRAAARRAVPPPPGTGGTQQNGTPSNSGSNDEKEATPQTSPSTHAESHEEDKGVEKVVEQIKPPPRRSLDILPPPRRNMDILPPPPRLPPRRPGHSVNSVSSDFGDRDRNRDHDDGRMEAIQARSRRGHEIPAEDEKTLSNGRTGEEKEKEDDEEKEMGEKKFAGNSTWEERTWKEIVRLREDMFWARVGAIRK